MDFFYQWLMLVIVFGAALVAPGPDTVMAVRNSVLHGRQAGIFTALGFAASVGIHILYTLAGLAAVISKSVLLFNAIKYGGAAYLLYMGYKALRSKGFDHEPGSIASAKKTNEMSIKNAFISGFLTNLLNPKASLFFLAIFSQFVSLETTLGHQGILGLTCVTMTACWFSCVAVILTHQRVRQGFLKASKWIDRVCGGLFILLGVRLALTKGVAP